MDHLQTIRALIADILGVSAGKISAETRQEDLPEWDSVSHLNLMLALEDSFGIRIRVDEIRTLRSVDAIVKFLEWKCPST